MRESYLLKKSGAPPLGNVLKLNVDASWIKGNLFSSIGCVVRDSQASVVMSSYRKVLAPSPLVAEAIALREGTLIDHNMGWTNVQIESDCKILIQACMQGKPVGEIRSIVHDIGILQKRLTHCEISWISRSRNSVAHLIAQLGLRNQLPPGWLWNPPKIIKEALMEDARCIPPRDEGRPEQH